MMQKNVYKSLFWKLYHSKDFGFTFKCIRLTLTFKSLLKNSFFYFNVPMYFSMLKTMVKSEF